MNISNFKLEEEILTEDDKKWIAGELESILKTKKNANASRYYELLWSYVVLKRIVKGENLKITYKKDTLDPYSPFYIGSDLAVIDLVGTRIEIMNGHLFKTVGMLASNFEIYPKTDGTLDMDFGFYGVENKEEV